MAGYVWVAVCHDQVTNVQCWPNRASCKPHGLPNPERLRSAARAPLRPVDPASQLWRLSKLQRPFVDWRQFIRSEATA